MLRTANIFAAASPPLDAALISRHCHDYATSRYDIAADIISLLIFVAVIAAADAATIALEQKYDSV